MASPFLILAAFCFITTVLVKPNVGGEYGKKLIRSRRDSATYNNPIFMWVNHHKWLVRQDRPSHRFKRNSNPLLLSTSQDGARDKRQDAKPEVKLDGFGFFGPQVKEDHRVHGHEYVRGKKVSAQEYVFARFTTTQKPHVRCQIQSKCSSQKDDFEKREVGHHSISEGGSSDEPSFLDSNPGANSNRRRKRSYRQASLLNRLVPGAKDKYYDNYIKEGQLDEVRDKPEDSPDDPFQDWLFQQGSAKD